MASLKLFPLKLHTNLPSATTPKPIPTSTAIGQRIINNQMVQIALQPVHNVIPFPHSIPTFFKRNRFQAISFAHCQTKNRETE